MPDPVPPNQQVPAGGVDPNVRVPPSVMAASRLAIESHQRAYGQPNGETPPNGQQATPPNGDDDWARAGVTSISASFVLSARARPRRRPGFGQRNRRGL